MTDSALMNQPERSSSPDPLFGVELLDPKQERELLIQHHTLRDQIDAAGKKGQSDEELQSLKEKMQGIRNQLIGANLRFANLMAGKFHNRGVPHDDLFAAAVTGLCLALDKFDLAHETRFNTYAGWHIIQQLQIAMEVENQNSPITTPRRTNAILGKVEQKLGSSDNMEEIAHEAGSSVEAIQKMQKARIAVSLSKALGDGGDATILISEIKNGDNYLMRDEIRNADINSTLQTVVASDTTRMIQQIFDFHLEPREKEILEMRYYHVNENNKPLTLREIGEKLNISNERVRQVQEQALKKLRSLEGNALADLLD